MSLPDAPNTLREKYYSVMAGQNDADILPDIETAPSTENRYLDYIAKHGGGGGGDDDVWLGTRAEHTAAESAGTLPETAIIGITDETGSGGSTVEVTQIKTSGEKIATITVDNVPTDIYASAGGSGGGAVDTVNGMTGDVVLTASDVGALPDNTSIPSKTSDLTNDSNFVADASYVHTDSNYTTAEKTKLSGIAAGAEVNVQSDWSQTDTDADDYIKNKPTIPDITGKADKVSSATSGNFAGLDASGNLTDSGKSASDFVLDASYVHTDNNYTTAEKNKLGGIATGATANTIIDTTATLAVADWTGASAPYTQTVNVTGILATDTPIIDISVSDTVQTGLDEIEQFAYISKAVTGAGTITFSCYEDKPDINLTLNIKVVR